MTDTGTLLAKVVGPEHVLTEDGVPEEYGHDESLAGAARRPGFVVRPATTAEVSGIVTVAAERQLPLTARGSGTGLSGACVPAADGVVVSFERMNQVLEIDTDNHVAVVQPGVTLAELDSRTAESGLCYPVRPGEQSASVGGTVLHHGSSVAAATDIRAGFFGPGGGLTDGLDEPQSIGINWSCERAGASGPRRRGLRRPEWAHPQ